MRTSHQTIQYIMQLSKEKEITQRELADRVGLTEATISRYVNEKRDFPIQHVPSFAKALDTTVEDLLGIAVDENQKFPNLSKMLSFTEEIGLLNDQTINSSAFQSKILQAILEDLRQLIRSKNSQSS